MKVEHQLNQSHLQKDTLHNLKELLALKTNDSANVTSSSNLSKQEMLNKIDINDGLKMILTDLLKNNKSPKTLLSLAKNSSIFKTFESFESGVKKLEAQIQAKALPISQDLQLKLKSVLIDLNDFNESKLKNHLEKTILSNEVKQLLVDLSQMGDKEMAQQANKMINQIEYYQLNSYLNQSIFTFLPIEWQEFNGGDIEFKEEDQKQFSCQIRLELETFGELKINLLYDEENHLSVGFFIADPKLKELITQELQILRVNLKESGVFVQNISLIDKSDIDKQETVLDSFKQFNNQKFDIDILA